MHFLKSENQTSKTSNGFLEILSSYNTVTNIFLGDYWLREIDILNFTALHFDKIITQKTVSQITSLKDVIPLLGGHRKLVFKFTLMKTP